MPLDHTIAHTLEAVASEQRSASEIVAGGATDADIAAANDALLAAFGHAMPAGYDEFLRARNGVDFNGLVLYSALDTPDRPGPGGFWQGLVAANQAWRDSGDYTGLIVLGDNSMDFFAYHMVGHGLARHDRVTGDVVERYPNMNDMIASAFASAQ